MDVSITKGTALRMSRNQSQLPLEALQIGFGFDVPAGESERFLAIRSYVWKYSKRSGRNIKCTLQQDGSLRVWRDNPAGEQSLIVGTIDQERLQQAMKEF